MALKLGRKSFISAKTHFDQNSFRPKLISPKTHDNSQHFRIWTAHQIAMTNIPIIYSIITIIPPFEQMFCSINVRDRCSAFAIICCCLRTLSPLFAGNVVWSSNKLFCQFDFAVPNRSLEHFYFATAQILNTRLLSIGVITKTWRKSHTAVDFITISMRN